MPPPPALRLGAVPYLNAKPLVAALRDRPGVVLSYHPPSGISGRIRSGDLELGLVPALDVAALPEAFAVAGVAIGSDGPVRSVLLCARVPPGRIRRLALDPSSRSSNALARILLAEIHGVRPETAAGEADARVLIGDPALKGLPGPWEEVLDLGEAWRRLSGLPFVYALWAGRGGAPAGAGDLLRAARRLGEADLEAVARAEAPAAGLPARQALDYLRDCIRYALGERERQGLRAFLELACRHGLLDAAREPAWI